MLSNKALLVHLQISQFTGRKLDKRATGTVEVTHATNARVGNYTKKLLPGARELERVNALAGSLRAFFYDNTLPWMADGSRILSAKHYLDFTAEYRKRKAQFEQAVGDLITAYPTLKAAARAKLGDLYNERDYPTSERLAASFACVIAIMPMPDVEDFRTEILDSERDDFLARMRDVESSAVRECYGRLHDVVSKAVDKLQSPDAVFRDSLIENIQEICALLPRLNITDDATLEATRQRVETLVAGISPDLCRQSAPDRAAAAKQLADIQNAMGAIMGGI